MPATQPPPPAPEDTASLIAHILARYHERHRDDFATLLPLAQRVEDVHYGDPDLPEGLADLVEDLSRDMEAHMAREEGVLFPLMLQGGHPVIGEPIAAMRRDHDGHGEGTAKLARLTSGFTPPEHACGSWRRLYAGLAQLAADLDHHRRLEEEVLFPRFEALATA